MEARVIKAVRLIHDDLVIAITVIDIVHTKVVNIAVAIIGSAIDCNLLLGLILLMLLLLRLVMELVAALLRWRFSLRKASTFDAARAEVTAIRQVLEAHICRSLLLRLGSLMVDKLLAAT